MFTPEEFTPEELKEIEEWCVSALENVYIHDELKGIPEDVATAVASEFDESPEKVATLQSIIIKCRI
jgi:hypothetical protein